MSDTGSNDAGVAAGRRRIVAVALAMAALGGVGGWFLGAGSKDAGEKNSPDSFAAHRSESAPTENEVSPTDHGPVEDERSTYRDGQRTARGTVIRQKLPDGDAGAVSQRDLSDAGESAEDAGPQWADPTNQKVLGQKQWMATLSDAESQAIDKAFDKPRPQAYPIDLAVRRSGVEVAREVVTDCFEKLRERSPSASGRVSVAFDLVANGKQARFLNAAIPANVHLEDASFEECILEGLSRASFATSEEGTMQVEYPFLFEDN